MEFLTFYKRYSKANNKCLKSYDPKQESKHIYLETNNSDGYVILGFFQQVASNG